MKTCAAFVLLAASALAQTATEPTMVLTLGIGASQFSEPHVGVTGSFGARIADGTYSLTSLDSGAKYDAVTKALVQVSTIRTGIQRRIVSAGALNLFGSIDAGLAAGGGSVASAISGGGAMTYDLPKHPGLFLYGACRVLRSANTDTTGSVQTAFSVGIGLKIGAAKP